MSYRGYELEQKTITRDGKFVRNGNVAKELGVAVEEAEKFVDRILADVDTAALGAKS
jgi:hypothetical protein